MILFKILGCHVISFLNQMLVSLLLDLKLMDFMNSNESLLLYIYTFLILFIFIL